MSLTLHYPWRRSQPRRWAPLSDEEVGFLIPYFARRGAGRPLHDIRGRLDAIFWAVTHDGPWKDLPPEMGPWDTASRQFRRWAHRGVWSRLLAEVASPRCHPVLRRLEHWLCRAFRRAIRILKMPGIRLARRLGLESALPGPPHMLPDPDLSKALLPIIAQAMARCRKPNGFPDLTIIRGVKSFHTLCGGRRSIPRHLAPP